MTAPAFAASASSLLHNAPLGALLAGWAVCAVWVRSTNRKLAAERKRRRHAEHELDHLYYGCRRPACDAMPGVPLERAVEWRSADRRHSLTIVNGTGAQRTDAERLAARAFRYSGGVR